MPRRWWLRPMSVGDVIGFLYQILNIHGDDLNNLGLNPNAKTPYNALHEYQLLS